MSVYFQLLMRRILRLPDFVRTRDPIRRELSALVMELQQQYPSLQHKQYEDNLVKGIFIGDPALRESMGAAYPNFMGPYFADFRLESPTRDRYELSQQFAFGEVDKKMHLFAPERAPEVRQMADEFGKLINGGYASCLAPISAATRHYDYQGNYSHSLVTVFSWWAGLEGIRDLIVTNVSEYVKQGRKNSVQQK